MSNSTLLPFQPGSMMPAQLATASYLARFSGHTHSLYAYQPRRWFEWCETGGRNHWSGSNAPTSSCTSATSAAADFMPW